MSTTTSHEEQLKQRGKSILEAHHSTGGVKRSAEEMNRLKSRGRDLLAQHMERKKKATHIHADPLSLLEPTSTAGAADNNFDDDISNASMEDLHAIVAASEEMHEADVKLVDELAGEVTILKKQLHQLRDEKHLHTPLKAGGGGGVAEPDSHHASFAAEVLQEQLAHLNAVAAENEAQRRIFAARNEELESENLALCATIAELQRNIEHRDEQLAKAMTTIDDLENRLQSSGVGTPQHPGQRDATGKSRDGSGAFSSPQVNESQVVLHHLEEQLHQLSREKLDLERENEALQGVVKNMQSQWNDLVRDLQGKEASLNDQLLATKRELQQAKESHGEGALNGDYVPKSQLEEQQRTLYAQFNAHIQQYQELANKSWAELVSRHQQELAQKDLDTESKLRANDAVWEEKLNHAIRNAATDNKSCPEPSTGVVERGSAQIALERLEAELQRSQNTIDGLEVRVDGLMSLNTTLTHQLQEAVSLREEAEEACRMCQASLREAVSQREEAEAACRMRHDDNATLHASLEEAKAQLQSLTTELESRRTEHATAESELRLELQRHIDHETETATSHSQTVSLLQGDIVKTRELLREANEENDRISKLLLQERETSTMTNQELVRLTERHEALCRSPKKELTLQDSAQHVKDLVAENTLLRDEAQRREAEMSHLLTALSSVEQEHHTQPTDSIAEDQGDASSQAIRALQAHVECLEKKLLDCERSAEAAAQQASALQDTLNHSAGTISSLQHDLISLQSIVDIQRKELHDVKAAHDEKLLNAAKEAASQKDESDELRRQVERYRAECEAFEEKQHRLEGDHVKMVERCDVVSSSAAESMERLSIELRDKSQECESLHEKLSSTLQQFDLLTTAHSADSQELARLNAEVERLTLREANQDAVIEEHKALLAASLSDTEFYKDQFDEVEAKLEKLRSQLDERTTSQTERSAIQQIADDAERRHKREIAHMESELLRSRELTRTAQMELQARCKSLESLEQELAMRAHDGGILSQSLHTKQQALQDAEASIEELRAAVRDAKIERAAIAAERDEHANALAELRSQLLKRTESFQQELNDITTQHSRDMISIQEAHRQEISRLKNEANDLREQCAVAETLRRVQSCPDDDRSNESVSRAQLQLAELARQNQRLVSQLAAAQDELEQKSSIIRDQDISLSSFHEHNTSQHQIQTYSEKIEELESRIKRLTRERDAQLIEKDALATEISGLARKQEVREQSSRRLEAELKASRAQILAQKNDLAAKMRQLSDFRQEAAQMQSRVAAVEEQLEEHMSLLYEKDMTMSFQSRVHQMIEAKLVAAALESSNVVEALGTEWVTSLSSFAANNTRVIRRCDEIESFTKEVLADGERQNRELRDRVKELTSQGKALAESNKELERRNGELQEALHQLRGVASDLEAQVADERKKCVDAASDFQKEMSAIASKLGACQTNTLRLEEDVRLGKEETSRAKEFYEGIVKQSESTIVLLRTSLSEKNQQLQHMRLEMDGLLESTTNASLALQRETAELQRAMKVQQSQLEDVLPRLDIAEVEVGRLTASNNELQRSIAKLTKQKDAEIERLRLLSESLAQSRDELSLELEALRIVAQQAQSSVDKLTLTAKSQGSDLEKLQLAHSHLDEQHTALVAASQEEIAQLTANLSAAEQKCLSLQKLSKGLESSTDELQERLRISGENLDRCERSRAELEKTMQIVHAEHLEQMHTMKRQLANATERASVLENDVGTLQASNRRLQSLVESVQDEKRQLLDQLGESERLLRETNGHNMTLNRELVNAKSSATEERERLSEEVSRLRMELLTARKSCASFEASLREAQHSIAAATEERQRAVDELTKTNQKLTDEVQSLSSDRIDKQERLMQLQRHAQSMEAELTDVKKHVHELTAQRDKCQDELAEHKSSMMSASERARSVLSEKEDLFGQVSALRDELRRQKLVADRQLHELRETLVAKEGDLAAAQQRMQQGSSAFRFSEIGLQQQVTDLTLSTHQLKGELATCQAAKSSLESQLDSERQLVKRTLAEAQQTREKFLDLEKETDDLKKQNQLMQQQFSVQQMRMNEELETMRQNAAADKKNALSSLERVIQADRQALADVRQARERALRACDQAQKEKADVEAESEKLAQQVRQHRREIDERSHELQAMLQTAELAAKELGLFDDSEGSPYRQLPLGKQHLAFSMLVDKLVAKFSNHKRAEDALTSERQQLDELCRELEQHEAVTMEAGASLQRIQNTLRAVAERIEHCRQQPQQWGRRSGSRSDDSFREGSAESNSNQQRYTHVISASSIQAQGHIRQLRSAHQKLLVQSVALEKCLKSASLLQQAMTPHTLMVEDRLNSIEYALANPLSGSGRNLNSSGNILEAAHLQRVALGAGMTVISTRVAQQSRLLSSILQQLRRWEELASSLMVEDLLRMTAAAGPSGVGELTVPLVSNLKETSSVFAQSDEFCSLSFGAIVSTSPVVHGAGIIASSRGAGSTGGGTAQRGYATDEATGDYPPQDDTQSQSSSDPETTEVLEEAAKRTRAFQKLRKENKRLYTLVRNLTEKLRVASTQAASQSQPVSSAVQLVPSGHIGGVADVSPIRAGATDTLNDDDSPDNTLDDIEGRRLLPLAGDAEDDDLSPDPDVRWVRQQ